MLRTLVEKGTYIELFDHKSKLAPLTLSWQIGTSVSKGTFVIASGAGKEFDIENTTGWLLAVKPFDREEKDVYQLQVTLNLL